MPHYPAFIGGTDRAISPLLDCSRTVNFYLEKSESEGAKNKAALYPIPGQTTFATLQDVSGRALRTINGQLYGVFGLGLYSINEDTTFTRLGALAQDSNFATICWNGAAGNQMFITTGGNGYVMNMTTKAITTVLNGTASMGGMIDGYFVAFDATTSKFQISALNDGLTWNALQYAQRSIAPDPWRAMLTADRLGVREIWLLGEESGEVWYDAGASGGQFPFMPIPGAWFKYGIVARDSAAAVGQFICWLSQNTDGAGIVVAARGYNPQPISSKSVEHAIATYQRTSKITDAQAFGCQIEGHVWYILRFPAANATWCYDLTTGVWTELGKWNTSKADYDAWGPQVHAYAYGKHFVGYSDSTTIATLDVTSASELDGSGIVRERSAPALNDEHRQIQYPRIELYLESGNALLSGQGSNPHVMLQWSHDGGRTWCPEKLMGVGRIADFTRRVYFNRCGLSRDRAFRVRMSDPIPWRIVDAYLDNTAPRGRA